jgi:hypothetical protein
LAQLTGKPAIKRTFVLVTVTALTPNKGMKKITYSKIQKNPDINTGAKYTNEKTTT